MEAAQGPSTDEWINNMECVSALKRKEILTHAATWMSPEDTMLSEITQSQNDIHCINSTCYMKGRELSISQRKQNGVVARDSREE